MKKKILTTLVILVLLVAYGAYRLGDRKITIVVDGMPAAAGKIQLLESGTIVDLDESGSLDLSWGLKKQVNPAFLFQTGPRNAWVLRLPDKGRVTFNISGTKVVTDVEMSVGLFKLKRKITQTHQPDDPSTQIQPIPITE